MQDLAMYLIEIIMNSIYADCSLINISIFYNNEEKKIELIVEDNGKGISANSLANITNPFMTSRTTRKIGLGVAMLEALCDQCEGSLIIKSKEQLGTITIASLPSNHWDIPPLGNIGEMMMFCIQANCNIDFTLNYQVDNNRYYFDTREIKQILDGVSLNEPEILLWIKDYINQNIEEIKNEKSR